MTEIAGPGRLREMLREFEILRGKVLAHGDIEDGTDTSVGVGILLDDGYALASEWGADLRRIDVLTEAYNMALTHLEENCLASPGMKRVMAEVAAQEDKR